MRVAHSLHVACFVAAISALAVLAGCSTDNGEAVNGGTTSTQATSLSMSQVESELKQYRPQAKDISCSEGGDGSIQCQATLDGRTVTFYGTPYGDTVGFTAGSGTK